MTNIGPIPVARNPFSVAVNSLIRATIAHAKARGIQQKAIAIEIGCASSAISHWASDESDSSIPTDMIPMFCAVTGDFRLLNYLLEAAGHPSLNEEAAQERPRTA